MKTLTSADEIRKIVNTDHYDPFTILGAHLMQRKGKQGIVIRSFLPDASRAEVVELLDGAEAQIRQSTSP